MKNNKLILYKENIFVKIHNFIKRIFGKKEVPVNKKFNEHENNPNISSNVFFESIQIKENDEEKRTRKLQQQYENGEIDEDDLSDEDIIKLCDLYRKETEELNADTERRKNHITQMLKELKNS